MSDTPETDAERMFGYGEFGGDWVLLERNCYEKHPEGDVIFSEVAERLERERDDARKEWDVARDGWSKALEERDEARRERDEAMQMLGEQLYQRVNEWTEEVERLLGELNAAREEVSALKAKLDHVSQMNQHADKSSVGDSTYVLTQQPCQRASWVRNC